MQRVRNIDPGADLSCLSHLTHKRQRQRSSARTLRPNHLRDRAEWQASLQQFIQCRNTDTRHAPEYARRWSERRGNPICEGGFDLLAECGRQGHGKTVFALCSPKTTLRCQPDTKANIMFCPYANEK